MKSPVSSTIFRIFVRMGRQGWGLLSLLAVWLSLSPTEGAYGQDIRKDLEKKAQYWLDNGREDLAAGTYRQILFLYPHDRPALTGLIEAYLLTGDRKKARPLIRTFENRYPESPYLPVFRRELMLGHRWTTDIASARQAEKKHDDSMALRMFHEAFGPEPPPPNLAEEYYQLVFRQPGGAPKARAELLALTKRYPQNASYLLAYGKILSYKRSTRRQSFRVLKQVALSNSPVRGDGQKAWRQALIWAGDTPSFIPEMTDYLKRFPDPRISRLLSRARSRALAEGPLPQKAFQALHAGRMEEARDRFLLLTKEDPDNASYWTGLASADLGLDHPGQAGEAIRKTRALPLSAGQQTAVKRLSMEIRYWKLIRAAKEKESEGDEEKAANLFRKARRILPRDPAAPDLLAELDLRRGRPGSAIRIARGILKTHPDDISARIAVMNGLVSLKKYRDALDFLRSTPAETLRQEEESSPGFLVLEGTIYAQNGNTMLADNKLESASKNRTGMSNRDLIAMAWAYEVLGEDHPLTALLARLDAIRTLSKGEAKQLRSLHRLDLQLTLNRLFRENRSGEAIDRVRADLEKRPDSRFLRRQEAMVFQSTGHPGKAFSVIRSLHPWKTLPSYENAIDIALTARHPHTARQWLFEARSRWGKRLGLTVLEARLVALEGHPHRARGILLAQLKVHPRSPRLLLALARLDMSQNRLAKAREEALEARRFAENGEGFDNRTNALDAANMLAAIDRQQSAFGGSHFEFLLGETVFSQYTQYYYTQIGGFFPVAQLMGRNGLEPVYFHAFVLANAFTFQYHPTPSSPSFLSQSYIGMTPAVGVRIPTFFGSVEADAGWGVALHDQTLTPPDIVNGLFLQGDILSYILGGSLDLFANYTGYINYTYFQSRYLHRFWAKEDRSLRMAAGPELIVQGNQNYNAFQGGAALRLSVVPLDSTLLFDGGILRSSAFGGVGGYEGFSWYFYY